MPGRLALTVLLATAIAATAQAAGPFALATGESIELGRQIFAHDWAEPESWAGSEPLGAGGDGLGPLFNAASCAACHQQGGMGGAGGNEHNVEVLSVAVTRPLRNRDRDVLLDRAHALHPQFGRDNASFVLHRYGFGTGEVLLQYTFWKDQLIGRSPSGRALLDASAPRQVVAGVPLEIAYRNTPPLWGLGLIEQIRADAGHRVRRDLVRVQQRLQQQGSSVSGRIPKTPDGEQGWYGWRGHVGTLRDFVLNACANELGLEVPKRSQPENPLTAAAGQKHRPKLDLTKPQVTALTAYIAQLPQPIRVVPGDPFERQAAVAGERLFHQIGCGECHVDDVGEVRGLYSDLLLHDMGPRTSDQSTSIPEQVPARRVTHSTGGYSGGNVTMSIPAQELATNIDQEWRTPPLWGVADSAPYFHDGRAQTLDEAIRWHDGEAARSAHEYDRLFDEHQRQLLTFLGTLRAPQIADESAVSRSAVAETMSR
ncbi:MAG: di-heme oxidoredictase family protein [Planctomycetaceae bacterium]